VIDKLLVGLHEDKTIESTIIKVIPTGTRLEILKQEGEMTLVEDSEGISGWIDNRYLMNTPPAQTLLQEAQTKADQLQFELQNAKKQIAVLETGTNQQGNVDTANDSKQLNNLRQENTELNQQFKSERLKVGELQAQLAELRNQMSQFSDEGAMAEKIKQLIEEKTALENQIAGNMAITTNSDLNINTQAGNLGWSKLLAYIFIFLLIGFISGVYILDLSIRRRHGGFRI
jgi:SH3 domain protein